MPWIFEYSELQPQDIVKLLGHAPYCSLPATLEKYQVVFKGQSRKWGGSLATIEKKKDSTVYGSAMLVAPSELDLFDKAHLNYKRQSVKVILMSGDIVEAQTYMVQDENVNIGQPSKDYLKTISKHLGFYWAGVGSKLKLEELFKLNTNVAVTSKLENNETSQIEISKKKKGDKL